MPSNDTRLRDTIQYVAVYALYLIYMGLASVEWIATPNGNGAVISPVKEIRRAVKCGCWVLQLAHGHAFVPCGTHEDAIVKIMNVAPVLPEKACET